MKTKLTLCGIICIVALIAWAENANDVIKVVSFATVPELVGTNLSARTFVFSGYKSRTTVNTGKIWIQRSSGNNAGGFPVSPGQTVSVTIDNAKARQMDFWIDVETDDDGVICTLIQ